MKILVACEFSGLVRRAFSDFGHDVTSCDFEDSELPGKHYKGDVLDIIDDGWDMVIAFPPCDNLAVSGRGSFRRKRESGEQRASVLFFMRMINCKVHYVAVENPVGIMNTLYRKPDQIIQPWMFGHHESKTTCLWLKNLPPLRPTAVVQYRPGLILCKNKKERSRTYFGIADAMAVQWGNLSKPIYG